MIHFGNTETKKTACGKSIVRRWWVQRITHETGRLGNMIVYRKVIGEATCPQCVKAAKK